MCFLIKPIMKHFGGKILEDKNMYFCIDNVLIIDEMRDLIIKYYCLESG